MESGDRGGEEVVAPSESVVLTHGVHRRQSGGTHTMDHLLTDRKTTPEEKKRAAARAAKDREITRRAQYHFSHMEILNHVVARMNSVAETEGRGIAFRLPTAEEGDDDHTVAFSPAAL